MTQETCIPHPTQEAFPQSLQSCLWHMVMAKVMLYYRDFLCFSLVSFGSFGGDYFYFMHHHFHSCCFVVPGDIVLGARSTTDTAHRRNPSVRLFNREFFVLRVTKQYYLRARRYESINHQKAYYSSMIAPVSHQSHICMI